MKKLILSALLKKYGPHFFFLGFEYNSHKLTRGQVLTTLKTYLLKEEEKDGIELTTLVFVYLHFYSINSTFQFFLYIFLPITS